MKIEITDLGIDALRDFDVGQRIELPRNQVTSIVGKNEDDGGSNGTGKSTMAMAIPINLFGPKISGISSSSLKNRYLSVPSRIVGSYLINGEPLSIDRTIGGKVRIKSGSKDWEEGKAEDIQAKINDIIKITQDQFMMLSNKAQGDYGGFLLMKDADKKEFLGSFFDVKFIDDAKEKAALELTDKEKKKLSLDGQLQYAERLLEPLKKKMDDSRARLDSVNSPEFKASTKALQDQMGSLEQNKSAIDSVLLNFQEYVDNLDEIKKIKDDSEAKIKSLDSEIASIREQIEAKMVEVASLMNRLNSIPEVPVELNKELDQINLVIREIGSRQRKYQELSTQEAVKKSEVSRLEDQLGKARESSCGSCGSKLSEEKIKQIMYVLQSQYLEASNQATKLGMDKFSMQVSEDDVINIQNLKSGIERRITSFKVENSAEATKKDYDSANRLIAALSTTVRGMETHRQVTSVQYRIAVEKLKAQTEAASLDLNVKISNLKATITAKNNELSIAAKEADRTSTDYVKATEDIAAIEISLNELKNEIEVLTGVINVTSKNGFVGYIFDSILEDLNSEINLNLKMIPNARKFSLQFTSDKIAKGSGAVSKAITYQLFSGSEEVEFNTLSGGEKLSTIISVDEALDTVLSRRLGVQIGWKFLDEQFSWIDENSKEALLEFYKAKSEKKAYFIVDHASEFNASLDSRIVIIKRNNLARFENANDLQ